MWRDDLDTAFRHLDLYDRFGCPGGHVQATFRCLTRFGGQIDPKVAETLDEPCPRLLDQPGAQPQAAAAARLPRRPRRPATPLRHPPPRRLRPHLTAGADEVARSTVRNDPHFSWFDARRP